MEDLEQQIKQLTMLDKELKEAEQEINKSKSGGPAVSRTFLF